MLTNRFSTICGGYRQIAKMSYKTAAELLTVEYGLRQQIRNALVSFDAINQLSLKSSVSKKFLTELVYIQSSLAFGRNLERIAADKGEAGWEFGYVSDNFKKCEENLTKFPSMLASILKQFKMPVRRQ